MEKRHLSVMIDAELYEKLKELAIKKHRKLKGALSKEVENAIRHWVEVCAKDER